MQTSHVATSVPHSFSLSFPLILLSSSRWFKECCSGSKPGEPNTNDEIYRILSWSFKALEDGHEPATDERGQPWPKGSVQRRRQGKDICGGYRMGVFSLKGDLEWFANVYRVPGHWNSTYPCMWCKFCKNDDDDDWAGPRWTIWTLDLVEFVQIKKVFKKQTKNKQHTKIPRKKHNNGTRNAGLRPNLAPKVAGSIGFQS